MHSSGKRCIQLEMRNVKHLLSTTSLIPVTSWWKAPYKNLSLIPRPSGNLSNIDQSSNSFFFSVNWVRPYDQLDKDDEVL